MQRFIAILGSAAHLAILAVAPLLLFPFASQTVVSTVLFALSPLLLVWMVMEPSVYAGEMPHDARRRVALNLRHDPLVWIWLVLIAYHVFCAVNSGVTYGYDPERAVWSLSSPRWAYLPGSADGSATFPLALLIVFGLVVLARRSAFGRIGGIALMLALSLLSGLAGLFWLHCHAKAGLHLPDGTLFGVMLVMAAVAVEGAFEAKWNLALPALIVAQAGNVVGLVVSAPLVTVLAFLSLWLLLSVWTLLRLRGRSVFFGGIAFPLVWLSSAVLAGLLLMFLAEPLVTERYGQCCAKAFFPDGFFRLRGVLSDCAKSAWLASPWTGSGIGTFALDIRAYLPAEAWSVVPHGTAAAGNGWWQFLAEGGIVRTSLWALMIGYVLFDWGRAVLMAVRCGARPLDPLSYAGPLTMAVLAVLAFFGPQPLETSVAMTAVLLTAASARTMESWARRSFNG